MKAKFMEIHEAADLLGPGAVESITHVSETANVVSHAGLFARRIRQRPASGHPTRYFEESCSTTRSECYAPLKAIVAQVDGDAAGGYIEEVMRTHEVGLWNGGDTSMAESTNPQYYGAAGQIADGGSVGIVRASKGVVHGNGGIVHGLKNEVARMLANELYEVRPTAIYANPVLLDMIDREMMLLFNAVLPERGIEGGVRVKMLSTQAGDLPLIPEWGLGYIGTPGHGAVVPCYIVTEPLIEYHWLTDPNPRVFQRGISGELASQLLVVKFGAVIVRGAAYAHRKVNVEVA